MVKLLGVEQGRKDPAVLRLDGIEGSRPVRMEGPERGSDIAPGPVFLLYTWWNILRWVLDMVAFTLVGVDIAFTLLMFDVLDEFKEGAGIPNNLRAGGGHGLDNTGGC